MMIDVEIEHKSTTTNVHTLPCVTPLQVTGNLQSDYS
jgi:hypothetical protein